MANVVVSQMHCQIMVYPYDMNNLNASKTWFGIQYTSYNYLGSEKHAKTVGILTTYVQYQRQPTFLQQLWKAASV
jgi:hypothetical protein